MSLIASVRNSGVSARRELTVKGLKTHLHTVSLVPSKTFTTISKNVNYLFSVFCFILCFEWHFNFLLVFVNILLGIETHGVQMHL